MKKIPYRMCIVTHEKYPKYELIRIVKDKDGNVFVDETGKLNGRGVYLKKDIEVLNKAKKTKILEKQLDVTIPNNVIEKLESLIGEE